MTTTDSQAVVPSDTTDVVFSTTKNDDNVQVEIPKVTPVESEGPPDESDFNLIYFRKGKGSAPGRRPQGGKMIPGQASNNESSTFSTSRNDSPAKGPAHPHRLASNLAGGGAVKPTKASETASEDNGRTKKGI